MSIKRKYLDFLYAELNEAKEDKRQHDEVQDFDGSPGSCHIERHRAEMTHIRARVEHAHLAIDKYLEAHGSES